MKTGNKSLNSAAKNFPRGLTLATANLSNSFFITSKELKLMFTGSMPLRLHNNKFTVAKYPLGEPVEDILLAIEDPNWSSYVWELEDVIPLDNPVDVCQRSNTAWSSAKIDATNLAKRQLITSYF